MPGFAMVKRKSAERITGRVLLVHFDRLGDFGPGASLAA